jgi:hypothetical protein
MKELSFLSSHVLLRSGRHLNLYRLMRERGGGRRKGKELFDLEVP